MSRPSGSKNKLDTQIRKLENAGYVITKKHDPALSVESGKNASNTSGMETPENHNSVVKSKMAQSVQIKTPAPKVATTETDTYRCGNKLCSYVTTKAFSVCPTCGVRNEFN